MAFKPGLSNVLNLKPTSSLRYTKYFPNNSEYASKVYPDKKKRTKHREAETQTDGDVVISKCADDIIVDVKPPIATCSQTEQVEVLQTYTQTDDTAIIEIAIQTEEMDIQDSSKDTTRFRGEKKKRRKERSTTQTSDQPQPGSSPDNPDLYNVLRNIWVKMKTFGEPRVVVSVIGAYNEWTPTYEWADNSLLKEALNHVARFAGRCGFIYKEKDTTFVHSVVKKCSLIGDLPHTYGYSSVHTSDHGKEQGTELVQENEKQSTGGQKQKQKNLLLDIETYINSNCRVSFQDGKEESRMLQTIRVPVVLLVVNGDLKTLKHVMRAINSDISVVVVKGTGGAADIIASCLENFSLNKLKRELPVMFTRRFTKNHFTKIENLIKRITEKDWMITIFDIKEDAHHKLWERITDGILRSWSLEEKDNDDSKNGGGYISKYVANIDGLTRKELFYGYQLNPEDISENKTLKENTMLDNSNLQNVFVNSFLSETTESIKDILTNFRYFYLSEENFKEIWKQEITSKSNTTIMRLLKSRPNVEDVYPGALKDTKAVKRISGKLLKRLCFSKIGMLTCCRRWGKKCNTGRKMPTIGKLIAAIHNKSRLPDTLRLAVLLNKKDIAAVIWYTCSNPMMTALISSIYLTALADVAEDLFEETLQEEYQSHAKLFLSRAIKLLEKMFTENERIAVDALEYVSDVWDFMESPLHLGHQFNIEEFISHSSIQIDATRRLFPINKDVVNQTHSCNTNIEESRKTTEQPASQKAPETNISTDATASQKASETNASTDATAFQKAPETNASTNATASQKAPETNASTDATVFQKAPVTNAPTNATALENEPVTKTSTDASQITQDNNTTNDNATQNSRNTSDNSTEKNAASQNIPNNNIANNVASTYQELLLETKTYPITVKGCFSFVKDNWRTSKRAICTAPFIKIIFHVVFFLTTLVMFSYFLTGNLDVDSISLLEGLVFIYMLGDILEEMTGMLVDLLKYLFILIILVLAAGVVYHANVYPNHQVTGLSNIAFWRIWTIIKIPYWQVYGELFLDTLEASDASGCTNNATLWKSDPSIERCPTGDWITPVIAAFYMMLTNWLLLNIVIAMFGARFNAIQRKSKQKWRYYRHSVIFDYEDKIPSPLNFPCRILTYLRYSKQIPCACCPCFEESKKGGIEKMLEKQLEFAKDIIEEENHQKSQ
ncbi:unnamed protein product [Mytilus coruscus]|uniref:Uncharacterized protein n=1 Tax=Mytilus coruscus TaxID=42192 RepID=A0A6J8DY16_MYTCO|nr:unnamed protein product [Mytilus coruscus]CAC5411681.1 unnamed protein product [Mytilus coruscus]